jgi:hypothetical protein
MFYFNQRDLCFALEQREIEKTSHPHRDFRPGDPGRVHARPGGPLIGEKPPLPSVARQGSS